MDEFEYITQNLSPLSIPNALNNDAFVYKKNTVITKDIIIEGVHFLKNTAAYDIAKKAIRINLSDIAAMGADPYGYFLGLAINNPTELWLNDFTSGLKEENHRYNIKLLGGDTTVHKGDNIISITMLGLLKTDKFLTRAGAKVGDKVYVSGNIGDASIGLLTYNTEGFTDLKEKYKFPEPQIDLGKYLLQNNIASSCLDISDGLVQDAYHICKESSVGMEIYIKDIPLSPSVKNLVSINSEYLEKALTGGDDYQLLFTSSCAINRKDVTEVGLITAGNRVVLKTNIGNEFKMQNAGYKHF